MGGCQVDRNQAAEGLARYDDGLTRVGDQHIQLAVGRPIPILPSGCCEVFEARAMAGQKRRGCAEPELLCHVHHRIQLPRCRTETVESQ